MLAQKFTDDIIDADTFFSDEKTFDAVLMNFVIIGEAVARLSVELKDQEFQIPWMKIKGFRNLVAHDYFGVEAEEVWQIIQNNLYELERDLKSISLRIGRCPAFKNLILFSTIS